MLKQHRSSKSSLMSPSLLNISTATLAFPRFPGTTVLTTCAVVIVWFVSLAATCYVYPADSRDPCRDKRCSFGAQCVPSLDGLTARCQCQDRCHSYGDSVGSTPVCGTDGHDYSSTCEMRRAACREMKDIEKKYDGKCDPCADLVCPPNQVCKLDDGRRPVCRCDTACPDDFSVVCGSDRRTYKNECFLRAESCKSGREIRLLSRGSCSPDNVKSQGAISDEYVAKGSNPCASLTCGPGEACHVDRTGRARCSCPTPCEKVVRPVCGTNGKTYDNECELLRQSCINRTPVRVLYSGECRDDSSRYEDKTMNDEGYFELKPCQESPCIGKKCQPGAVCKVRKGEAVCECPTCTEEFDPVCASDGLVYHSECKLNAESCRRKINITVKNRGLCDSCDDVRCSFGEYCVEGTCTCQRDCAGIKDNRRHGADDVTQLCGSDGVTYTSECAMRLASCTQRMNIEILYSGRCEEFSGHEGPTSVLQSICDETNCRFGGFCRNDVIGNVVCSCNFNCPAIRSPVCASDGNTYGNECEMSENSCRFQRPLHAQPMENCQDIVEELCDGNAPLVNPSTGRSYDCDRGRESCPAGSYCHRLSSVAGCCKEEQSRAKICKESKYGCCPDDPNVAALGPDGAGCPSICQCNSLGSLFSTCEPVARQCVCRPRVGGVRCDRCEPTYWGFAKISDGQNGCIACGCNVFGSVREDCEQMTGKCACKPGFSGQKCSICPDGSEAEFYGCSDGSSSDTATCNAQSCRFGGVCSLSGSVWQCVCPASCITASTDHVTTTVCGNDGRSYQSICHLHQNACRLQKEISPLYDGPCHEASLLRTALRLKFKENEDHTQSTAAIRPQQEANSIEFPVGMKTWSSNDPAGFDGWVRLKLENAVSIRQVASQYELSLRTRSRQGLLLLQHQPTKTHLIAVAIVDGRVETTFNLGKDSPSRLPVARSQVEVADGTWHTLAISRDGRILMLSVDHEDPIVAFSMPGANLLDSDGSLWIGGFDGDLKELSISYGVRFIGCVGSVRINGTAQNLFFHGSKDTNPLPICVS